MTDTILEDKVQIAAFLLADHAEAVGGKLHMTGGGWNELHVTDLPHRQPHFSIAMSILVPWSRQNERHDFVIELLDADNNNAGLKVEGQFEAGRPAGRREGDFALHNVVVNVNQLEATALGSFYFVISVDGEQASIAPFKVVKAEAATG